MKSPSTFGGGPRDRPASDFVGRRRELRALAELLEGSVRAAFIQGEAGIGKSSLLDELATRARSTGVRVLQGYCYPLADTGPYAPFLQVLRQLSLQDDAAADGRTGLLGDGARLRPWDQVEDVRAYRSRVLRRLSEAICRRVVSGKTLLCVEDLQWADLGSLFILNNLVDMRARDLLIACTARVDERVAPEARQLIARIEDKSHRIVLQGFDQAEVREFVGGICELGRLTEEEVAVLRRFTRGNPLFVRELLLHLQESGLLDRHTLPEAIQRSRTPDSVAHVIDLRLRALPSRTRRVLGASSVIGPAFSRSLLLEVLGTAEDAVESHLARGVSAGILRQGDGLASSRYEFTHPLVAMRLYDGLSAGDRRRWHRRVAEAAHRGVVSLALSEAARHHAAGGGAAASRRTVGYCRAAAEEAEGLLAYESAARFWELAATSVAPRFGRTKADVLRRLGLALRASGKWTQVAEVWGEAVRCFESLQDSRAVGELALALGDMHRWRQELPEAERWLRRATELQPQDPLERAKALALLGSIRCLESLGEGSALLEEAAVLADREGLDPLVAFWLSQGFAAVGDLARAYAVTKAGLDRALQTDATHTGGLLAGNLVINELSRGRLPAARRYARIVEVAADSGDTSSLIRSLLCQALLLGYTGRWRRVAKLCERWMAEVRLASRYQVATARLVWGEAQHALGNSADALAAMARALPELEQMRPVAALHLARALLRAGQTDDAASLTRQYGPQILDSPRLATARVLLGEVASALDLPAWWQQCHDALASESRRVVMVYAPISVDRVRGRLAGRLKRWPASIEHFDTAVRHLAEGGATWELVQTFLDCAELRRSRRRRGDLAKAAALEQQAERLLNDLGIPRAPSAAEASADACPFSLTGRELEVLALVAEGRRNREIAESMTLSERTVERHLGNIFAKMAVDSRTEAVVKAVQAGLVGPLASVSRDLGS